MSTESDVYVPWSQREGWEDLQPVPQNDAPNCLVPIAYHEQCQSPLTYLLLRLNVQLIWLEN